MPYVKHCPTEHMDIQYLQEAVIPVQECQSISEPCGHTSADEACVQPLSLMLSTISQIFSWARSREASFLVCVCLSPN